MSKPQPQNRIPLFLSSYTTKLDQIQYPTLFQPNQNQIEFKMEGDKKIKIEDDQRKYKMEDEERIK